MASTASTQPEGVTFVAGQEEIAARVEAAEAVLYRWACGDITGKQARAAVKAQRIELLERLNASGPARIDAHVDGFGDITLTF